MAVPVLYHFPPSPYSMRARIVLAEKGIPWEGRVLNIIREKNYEPSYVKLHPGAVVPMLGVGDEIVVESDRIVRFLEERYPEPSLTPTDEAERARMEEWYARAMAFSLERIHAATMTRASVMLDAFALGRRVKRLEALARKHPDLEAAYTAKAADIARKHENAARPITRAEAIAEVEAVLDRMESELAKHPWLAGSTYSLADVMWTVVLSRFSILGLSPLWSAERRPAVARWWARIVARPSFTGGDVWTKMKPLALAPYVAPIIAPVLVGLVAVIAVVAWLVARR